MASINDIVSYMENGFSDNSIVKKLIDNDIVSSEKDFMIKANNYYNSKNDVLNIDFREYVSNGVIKTNLNRSNQKISNNFFKLIVDQLVNYTVGKGITYKSEDIKFMQYLDKKLMYDFTETISIWLEESRIKGRSYLHFYYDKQGLLNYAVIPSQEIIPLYKDDFKKELQQVIRYYSIPVINEKGEQVLRKKVEWWTETEVKYFIEDDKGNFNFTESKSHWTYSIDFNPDLMEGHNWGKVPFIELKTCIRATSDLQDIKPFIDSYDILISEFVNQIADIREILIKVLGYSGTTADEILQAFRATGIVKIDDNTGNIDVIKSEIPVEARKEALKTLKDNIFVIGKGVDTNPEKYGTSLSGIAIQMMYRPLDMKADIVIERLKRAVGLFMWFIADDYNRSYNANVDYMDITVSFNKNTLEDVNAIIDSSVKLKGIVSDETIWERIPFTNPQLESERMLQQEDKELENYINHMYKQETIPREEDINNNQENLEKK